MVKFIFEGDESETYTMDEILEMMGDNIESAMDDLSGECESELESAEPGDEVTVPYTGYVTAIKDKTRSRNKKRSSSVGPIFRKASSKTKRGLI